MPVATNSPPIRSGLDPRSGQFQRNRADVLEQIEHIDALLDEAAAGGGPEAHERWPREASCLFASASPSCSTSAARSSRSVPRGVRHQLQGRRGALMGIGVVSGVECVIIGNDPSVSAGAFTPHAGKKWARALEIARTNRMPYIGLVESAGADLNVDPTKGPAPIVQVPFHFGESGRQFYEMTELSKLGIPTISVVFGPSTAGGAYQPGRPITTSSSAITRRWRLPGRRW